jgi:hypothetical protein
MNDIFQASRVNNCQPRILYSAKLFFKIKGKLNFQDKQQLKQFMNTETALQNISSHTEKEESQSQTQELKKK